LYIFKNNNNNKIKKTKKRKKRRAMRVVVVGYIVHYDSLSFLDTWMPFCVTKYYHVFVSFNLLCLKTLVPYDITFSSEIRQYIP
jgi:hypothetical protein